MIARFEKIQEWLTAPKAGMVAARGVLEIIVKDAGLSVAKSNLYQGQASQHRRILLFYDHPRSPLGISVVYYPVANF